MRSTPSPRPDILLERALLANFFIHGVAMLAMALLLAPMLPGGGEPDPAIRVAAIAAHPWLFRAGWLPWQVVRAPDGTVHLALDPDCGTGPDAEAMLSPCAEPAMEGPWQECFPTFRDFLAYCVPQDRAMSTQPWAGTVTRQEIDLGIPLDACEPLTGEVRSRAATAIAGAAKPLCFRVPSVLFRFDVEEKDPLPADVEV